MTIHKAEPSEEFHPAYDLELDADLEACDPVFRAAVAAMGGASAVAAEFSKIPPAAMTAVKATMTLAEQEH